MRSDESIEPRTTGARLTISFGSHKARNGGYHNHSIPHVFLGSPVNPLILWCRRSDLNRGPADYESAALPLSYVGAGGTRPYSAGGSIRATAVLAGAGADGTCEQGVTALALGIADKRSEPKDGKHERHDLMPSIDRGIHRAMGVHWTDERSLRRFRPASHCAAGWVAERFKAAVLKTANPQGFVGSNPTPSAEDPAYTH